MTTSLPNTPTSNQNDSQYRRNEVVNKLPIQATSNQLNGNDKGEYLFPRHRDVGGISRLSEAYYEQWEQQNESPENQTEDSIRSNISETENDRLALVPS